MAEHAYLLALGSNVRHGLHGRPPTVIAAAFTALDDASLRVTARSPVVITAPIGPSSRRYANAAAIVASDLDPPRLLDRLKRIEKAFGRRRNRRWGARVLDIDIVLWSAGPWRSRALTIPHTQYRNRAFVLGPANAIAPHWRDPDTGFTLRQLYARLTHPRPAPR